MMSALVISIRGAWIRTQLPFYRRPGRQVREIFEGPDERRPAIGIARVVDGVHADVDVLGAKHFGVTQGACEKYGVSRGHIRHRDSVAGLFRDGNRSIGQGRMPEFPDRHRKHPMLDRPERIADAARGAKLDGVPLAVVE